MLSPLLYSLFTHDCMATHASNSVNKLADNTTVVGLITNNNKTAYREEVRDLGVWYQENNLSLNLNKMKERISGDSRGSTPPSTSTGRSGEGEKRQVPWRIHY